MLKHRTRGRVATGILVLAGVGAYLALQPAPANAPTGDTDDVAEVAQYTEHMPYYEVDASYPARTPLQAVSSRADTAAVELMKAYIDTTIRQFKSDGGLDRLTKEDIATLGLGEGRKESLRITYSTATSPRTISYIFTVYQDTLGAHGNTYFRTFTFSTTDGSSLLLKDLFVPNTAYLDTLSSISRAKLPAIIAEATQSKLGDVDADSIKQGTGPNEANFANFFLDGTSLVILFPPYAVAAYAAGPQTLAIPITDLKSILKSEHQ